MFKTIGSVENIPAFLEKCKNDKKTRLWGFGHRIFKAYDPRARELKRILEEFN
jgi:citrate synthase